MGTSHSRIAHTHTHTYPCTHTHIYMYTHILLNYKSFHIKSSLLEPAKRVPPARLGPRLSFGYDTVRYGTVGYGTAGYGCDVGLGRVPAGCNGYCSCHAPTSAPSPHLRTAKLVYGRQHQSCSQSENVWP